MIYKVRCGCTQMHFVTAGDAGSSLRCACGRTVEVLPLHLLRTAGGESAIPLLVQVRSLILNGQLPGTRHCARCHQPTNGMMRVGIACEPTPGESESHSEPAVGCLLGLIFGSVSSGAVTGAISHIAQEESPDVSLVVPLPVCDSCRSGLVDQAALRQALRHVPEYAALLDQYPNARIILMS